MITFDELKRQSNIVKHGIDFMDAEAAFVGVTITRTDSRDDYGEQRLQTLAIMGGIVVLIVHVLRGHIDHIATTLFQSERLRNMKKKSTGSTRLNDSVARVARAAERSDDDAPSTKVADWDGAVVAKNRVPVAVVRLRGAGKRPAKQQVAIRFSPDVLAALRASGPGWQTRVNETMRERLGLASDESKSAAFRA